MKTTDTIMRMNNHQLRRLVARQQVEIAGLQGEASGHPDDIQLSREALERASRIKREVYDAQRRKAGL